MKYIWLIVVGMLCSPFVFAQDGELNFHAGFEPWPHYSKNIQHRLLGGIGLGLSHNDVLLEGYIHWIWWGRREFVRVPGSPLNAESGKYQERRHGLTLSFPLREHIRLGIGYDRRAVIQYNREEDWPDSDDARTQLKEGPPWPTIGYHDGIRLKIEWGDSTKSIGLHSPAWRYHNNTLPWPNWILHADAQSGRWYVRVQGQRGGLQPVTADIEVSYALGAYTYLGIRAGRLPYPGYRGSVDRIALVIHANVIDRLF